MKYLTTSALALSLFLQQNVEARAPTNVEKLKTVLRAIADGPSPTKSTPSPSPAVAPCNNKKQEQAKAELARIVAKKTASAIQKAFDKEAKSDEAKNKVKAIQKKTIKQAHKIEKDSEKADEKK